MNTDSLDRYAEMTDADFAKMAIEWRNEVLDELRRREETIEAGAEERRYGIVPWYWKTGSR